MVSIICANSNDYCRIFSCGTKRRLKGGGSKARIRRMGMRCKWANNFQMEKTMTRKKYDNQQIAKEIQLTASGQYYYGNALYVAMDMPEIVAAPEQRHAILRYLTGTQNDTDHIKLQEAAMLISPTQPNPTQPQ